MSTIHGRSVRRATIGGVWSDFQAWFVNQPSTSGLCLSCDGKDGEGRRLPCCGAPFCPTCIGRWNEWSVSQVGPHKLLHVGDGGVRPAELPQFECPFCRGHPELVRWERRNWVRGFHNAPGLHASVSDRPKHTPRTEAGWSRLMETFRNLPTERQGKPPQLTLPEFTTCFPFKRKSPCRPIPLPGAKRSTRRPLRKPRSPRCRLRVDGRSVPVPVVYDL